MQKSTNISHPRLYVTMVRDHLKGCVPGRAIAFECNPSKHLISETSWAISQHHKGLLFSTGIIFVCKILGAKAKKSPSPTVVRYLVW